MRWLVFRGMRVCTRDGAKEETETAMEMAGDSRFSRFFDQDRSVPVIFLFTSSIVLLVLS